MGPAHVYVDYWNWASDSYNEKKIIEGFLTGIGGTKWLNTVAQYYGSSVQGGVTPNISNPGGTPSLLAGEWNSTDALPSTAGWTNRCVIEAEVSATVAHFASLGYSITNDPNAIIVIARPPSAPFISSGGACGGYHNNEDISSTSPCPASFDYPYIELSYTASVPSACDSSNSNGALATTNLLFHELTETITDPQRSPQTAQAWACGCNPNFGEGGEIADMCQVASGAARQISLQPPGSAYAETYWIDPLWSNNYNDAPGTAGCVFAHSTRLDSIYSSATGVVDDFNYCGSWSSGNAISTSPGAVSWGPNRLDMFATDSNNHINHFYTGNGCTTKYWDDWGTALSPYHFVYKPDAASWGTQRLDLFSVALNGATSVIEHRSWNPTAFSGWSDIGYPGLGQIQSGVTAVSMLFGRADLFVFEGQTTLRHAYTYNGTSYTWDNWGNPGSVVFLGNPDACSWGDNRIDVFGVDTNGDLWHRYWDLNANVFSNWENWGHPTSGVGSGPLTGPPSCVAQGDNRLQVGAMGPLDHNIFWVRQWASGDLGWQGNSTGPGGHDLASW